MIHASSSALTITCCRSVVLWNTRHYSSVANSRAPLGRLQQIRERGEDLWFQCLADEFSDRTLPFFDLQLTCLRDAAAIFLHHLRCLPCYHVAG